MISVIIPISLLLIIVLVKKIPYIGGNIHVALLVAGASALLLSGIYSPMDWLMAWIDGLNRLSWVILIAIFGMIYAETQLTMGTMDTVLDTCRAAFGKSPKGLYVSAMVAMIIFGALLGEGLSVASVVGVLCISPLFDLGLKPEEISASLVLGALLGSLCPPMSNGIVLSASLAGADYDTVLKWSFLTVPACCVVITTYYAFRFVKIKELPAHLIPQKKAGQILKEGWKVLVPMGLLLLIMILRFGPWDADLDFVSMLWSPLIKAVNGIPFISGMSNLIVLSLITVTIVTFFYKKIRERGIGDIVKVGFKKFIPCGAVQVCCALMLGGFYAGGLIDKIAAWAVTLNTAVLKLGGSLAMGLMGMITGSQSTVQNTILSFFGPALIATGMTPERVALAGSHIAMAAQAFPPTDLCTIVVVGLVTGVINKECNYVKSMMTSLPGFLFLYGFGVLLLFV
ncbi:MAG: TRAP transporter large permease subunit [Peptococcaceae bacterium]|nr:TRAP transporter large permease subunit [Peptococcaceae bacterium]